PFIISNATALHIYRSLTYGNRLLCSTECDTLLSNLGVYGNQYNDPRYAENVNMLIQMFDGTKHQNRSTLSTSYVIPEGRRASIIGASVGDPYARVSQQHYEGTGIIGAHNRFTHYACPVMKAIKTNAGSTGVISNMVPSLQHVYIVSILIGQVEYVARQNVYDKSEKKQMSMLNADVEDKWKRLRSTANREYYHSPSQIEVELEELEDDATLEQSKSAFYYMFNRVYNQWEEATLTEKEEHEAIIDFKNSTKIPRFICNFARFRSIMNILWHDDVYPFIEISEVIKPPYCVSGNFIEAVKNVIDKVFSPNLRKSDGTKILIIEKDTAIMGDLFFGHVDYVSRQLFDISTIHDKFNPSTITPRLLKSTLKCFATYNSLYADASIIILSKFVFFSISSFSYHRKFHNKKDQLNMVLQYLVANGLIFQTSSTGRFIKGVQLSYAMMPPNQIKQNNLSIEALAKLNLNIYNYEDLWMQCCLPAPEVAAKLEKSAMNHIKLHLIDYISIIHRLGDAKDPIAREILKPGLIIGQIGIDFDSNKFSLAPEHSIRFNDDDEIMKNLNRLCIRVSGENVGLFDSTTSSTINGNNSMTKMPLVDKTCIPLVYDYGQVPTEQAGAIDSNDLFSNEYHQTTISQRQFTSNKEADTALIEFDTDDNSIDDCIFLLEKIKTDLENDVNKSNTFPNGSTTIQQSTNIKSSETYDNLAHIASNSILSYGKSFTIQTNNNKISDDFSSTEFDYSNVDPMIISDIDHSLCYQQYSNKELFSKSFSPIVVEYHIGKEDQTIDSDSMMIDTSPNFQASSPIEMISIQQNRISETLSSSFNEETSQSSKNFEHELIMQIDDLFLSSAPTKKVFKSEVGYLKLFPASESLSQTASFEVKLREKVGITFDDYVKKVFSGENVSMSISVINNIFNTAHHNWLLNRNWFDKLNEGYTSVYYQNKIICPDSKMSLVMVTLASTSNDNVHDALDRPKCKLTASERTSKELRRLGVKRKKELDVEHTPKRQRKRRRFHDEE
ncbi:unnamed protein product, partial [Rotaria magnacalcarata]